MEDPIFFEEIPPASPTSDEKAPEPPSDEEPLSESEPLSSDEKEIDFEDEENIDELNEEKSYTSETDIPIPIPEELAGENPETIIEPDSSQIDALIVKQRQSVSDTTPKYEKMMRESIEREREKSSRSSKRSVTSPSSKKRTLSSEKKEKERKSSPSSKKKERTTSSEKKEKKSSPRRVSPLRRVSPSPKKVREPSPFEGEEDEILIDEKDPLVLKQKAYHINSTLIEEREKELALLSRDLNRDETLNLIGKMLFNEGLFDADERELMSRILNQKFWTGCRYSPLIEDRLKKVLSGSKLITLFKNE